MSDPITITIPVVVNKKFQIFWSEDTVIELHDKYLLAKDDYISEKFLDKDDENLGKIEDKTNYESLFRKDMISEVEWVYDNKNGYYAFQINMVSDGCISWPTETKKEAVENYTIIKNWLLK